MARIVIGCYFVRYPLAGMMSWVLQYIKGLHDLGHEVFIVENGDYDNACYDPVSNLQSDDFGYGLRVATRCLETLGLKNRICFMSRDQNYHGLSRATFKDLLKSADLFLELGDFNSWLDETGESTVRVFVDGDPGMTQMKFVIHQKGGGSIPEFDHYYTVGRNVGLPGCNIPTAGIKWKHIFHPVCTKMYQQKPTSDDGFFTTVMHWQSYDALIFEGKNYGHKDIEFEKFIDLPKLTSQGLELAVAGKFPKNRLLENGWRIRDGHSVTLSLDSYAEYLSDSRGEFTVCKNAFVDTESGWFGDRSSAYLATGRPVIMQETGFSRHLPCGLGLFAVKTSDEAASVIEEVTRNYKHHANGARDIAMEYLDAPKVMGKLLDEIGI